MLQFRANSLSFTHAALCSFNLSRVTGKSIVTEGVGGRMIYFSFLLLQSNCIFSLSTAVVHTHYRDRQKEEKNPPNKQDVGRWGIVITCWACQYKAIHSLLSRSLEIPVSFVQNSCSSRGLCANPRLCAVQPNPTGGGFNQGRVNKSHLCT